MQGHLDVQLARRRVKACGRVVAQHGAGFGENRAAVLQRRQRGALAAGLGQDELEVVVKARAHKARQLGPAQGEAHKAWAHCGAPQHLQKAGLQGVANALDGERSCGRQGGIQRSVHDLKC